MIADLYLRDTARGVPPRLPQDVIDEIASRPRDSFAYRKEYTPELDEFFSNDWKIFNNDSYAKAFGQALEFVGTEGYIATAPWIIAAMAKSIEHVRWRDIISPLTERITGVSKSDEQVTVIVHGGGILRPESSAEYPLITIDSEVIDDLLKGKLPNGESIEIYSLEDVKRGNVQNQFGRYGVLLRYSDDDEIFPYNNGAYFSSLKKLEFMASPLMLALAGSPEYLEVFIDNCANGVMVLTAQEGQGKSSKCFGPSFFWCEYNDPSRVPEIRVGPNVSANGRFFAVNPFKEAPQ